MTEKNRILVIDDEIQIRRLLQLTLSSSGYDTILASTAEEGLTRAGMDNPDLILLDLGLPDTDGMEVLKKLREWAAIPIVVVSVRDTEQDIVNALDAGADDYLTKPFRKGELLARLRTALRHKRGEIEESQIKVGPLTIDLAGHTVRKNGVLIKLTSTEFELLALFVKKLGRVLTHSYILEQVWGHAYAEETQYTRVYVAQLRKKIEDDPSSPKLILTESGIGYRMLEEQ
jgi:two-component system KDP operon response regulator KdpE